MFISDVMMNRLFQGAVDGIVSYIKQIKDNDRLVDVNTIVFAGGFSKCDKLKKAICEEFPDNLIVSPTDPGIAILKVF